VKGFVRGYDVKTGKRLWIFHTIPAAGRIRQRDLGKKSRGSTRATRGVWGQISIDEELGLAYLPVEMPTGDYYGGHRPRQRSVRREPSSPFDLQTGKRKWHYQLVHHGIWDMDIPCAPILTDITINGRVVKSRRAADQAGCAVRGRSGDGGSRSGRSRNVRSRRVTCPASGIRRRSPSPRSRRPYERTGVSVDDLIDFTPELHAEAVELSKKYAMGPRCSRRPVVSRIEGPLGLLTRAPLRRHELEGRVRTIRRRISCTCTRPARSGQWGSCRRQPASPTCATSRATRLRAHVSPAEVAPPQAAADLWRAVQAGASSAAVNEDAGGGLSIRGLPLGKPPLRPHQRDRPRQGAKSNGRSRTAKHLTT